MKSNLSKGTFKKFWKWFEKILKSFQAAEWDFHKNQLLELFFFQEIFKIWKIEKIWNFISFVFDEVLSAVINPAEGRT